MCVHVLIVNVHHLAFITHCSTYTLQVYMHLCTSTLYSLFRQTGKPFKKKVSVKQNVL